MSMQEAPQLSVGELRGPGESARGESLEDCQSLLQGTCLELSGGAEEIAGDSRFFFGSY